MTEKITVLVTGVGGRSVGHQILHALLLAGERYRIVATDASSFSYGLYQVDSRYVLPMAVAPDYLPALQRIVEKEGVQVVLPGTEPEVKVLASAALKCPVLVNPPSVVDLCSDKYKLYAWLREHGFDVPRSVRGTQWKALVAESSFPIVGKPTRATGGSRGVMILKDEAEVNYYLEDMPLDQVMFQEYVGTADDEYTVGVLISREGEIIDSIVLRRKLVGLTLATHRKIGQRTYALSTGYSQGIIVKHAHIQATCEKLVLELGMRGPANIQLRLDGERVVVFEVHARFSGTTSIRADVGFNETDVLIRNYLLGEKFGRLNYQTDVAAIRAFSNIIVPVAVIKALPSAGSSDGL